MLNALLKTVRRTQRVEECQLKPKLLIWLFLAGGWWLVAGG